MVEATYTDPTGQGLVEPGDNVVLAEGPYQGSPGVLLRLKEDKRWAEIREWDDKIRSHPVAWLRKRS